MEDYVNRYVVDIDILVRTIAVPGVMAKATGTDLKKYYRHHLIYKTDKYRKMKKWIRCYYYKKERDWLQLFPEL